MNMKKNIKKKSFQDLKKEVVDRGECASCGTCVVVCPKELIILSGEKQEPIITSECSACGICYDSCPGLSTLQSGS